VLVDEVNRAMPRTQSALLEAMAERQVTVDGSARTLPEPFLVIATENPIEQEGTFPLPEAQLDRFALQTGLGYPTEDDEVSIVLAQRHGHPLAALGPVISADEVRVLQRAAENVYIDDLILRQAVAYLRTVAGTGPTIHVAGTDNSRIPLAAYVALLGLLMLLAALGSASTALTGCRVV
jgi:MoxR-like ATPase